jgi:hypothetical protein
MSVAVGNLIQGPGTLYRGAFGATEPADLAINTTPQSSAWTDVGGTKDGVSYEIARTYAELAVDQIVDIPDRRLTKREFNLTTNLAEVTLENLAYVSNDTQPTSGANFKAFEPTITSAATQPTFVALLFDGYAPGQFRRRIIGRRMLSVDSITIAYKKEDQTVLNVKWAGHYVSDVIKPWKVIDQTV